MAAKLTEAELKKFVKLNKDRKAFDRKSDALKRAAEPIKQKILAYIDKFGGAERNTTHYGHVLAMVPYQKKVDWKLALIEATSPERAAELHEKAPMTYTLSVEPAAAG